MQRFQSEIGECIVGKSQKLMACSKIAFAFVWESNEPDSTHEYYDASKMIGRLEVTDNLALSPRGASASQDGSCLNLLFFGLVTRP